MPSATALAIDLMDGPFIWGRADCCTAACDVFRALHGVDPMAPLRGQYISELSARRLIRHWGGWHAMTADLAARAGLVAVPGAEGDLGLAKIGRDLALVIGIERGLWAGKGADGVVTTSQIVAAWRVRGVVQCPR
jgi:hypothetical protein